MEEQQMVIDFSIEMLIDLLFFWTKNLRIFFN